MTDAPTVLVTGVSRGLGLAIARDLLDGVLREVRVTGKQRLYMPRFRVGDEIYAQRGLVDVWRLITTTMCKLNPELLDGVHEIDQLLAKRER